MSTDPDRADKARAQAEARFKMAEQRKTDADKVWAEMEAGRAAEIAKTDRLRALRLAKEAADREAAAAAPVKGTKARKKTPA
jgi:hypothetical protein